ncbi:MAG: hypothetical protein AAGC46_09125 [Solirubrobacteraceae bacterium]|nr:hypothetical protein [Patulibacter sp.]
MDDATPTDPGLVGPSQRIEGILAGFAPQLGRDAVAYGNHVRRVFGLVRAQGPQLTADDLEQTAIAAVFHDLGVWTHHTFDYLEPSIALAAGYLDAEGLAAWGPRVHTMILEHHKLRPYRGDPVVEWFRRADLCDLSFGLRRSGIPRAAYRDLAAAFPSAGFHRRIAQLATTRAITHPLRPAPMMRW